MTQITRTEAEALAAFVCRVRADWDHPGVVAAIRKAAHCGTPLEVAVALCTIAKDRQLRTPALLAEKGRHWTQEGAPVGPNASHDTPCGVHGLRLPCTACADEAKADPIDPAALSTLLAQARAQVAEGVSRVHTRPMPGRVPPPGVTPKGDHRVD